MHLSKNNGHKFQVQDNAKYLEASRIRRAYKKYEPLFVKK